MYVTSVYRLDHFRSVVSRTPSPSCGHPHRPPPELSHCPKLTLCPHQTPTLHTPALSLRRVLGTVHMWTDSVLVLLWLISLSAVSPSTLAQQVSASLPAAGGAIGHCRDRHVSPHSRANEPWLALTFWLLEQCFCEHGCAKDIFKGHSCGLLPQATTSQHQPVALWL